MDHDAAGLEDAARLLEHAACHADRMFVQKEARAHKVEALVRIIGAFGVLLRIVHRRSQRFGARVSIPQQRCADVDPMRLAVRKHLQVGQKIAAHRAAQIEQPLRLPAGQPGFEVVRDRLGDPAAARAQGEACLLYTSRCV